jgi:hypothetical protein
MSAAPVLLTWVAVNNDPYERDGQSGLARLIDGAPIPGPTLSTTSRPTPAGSTTSSSCTARRQGARTSAKSER